MPLVIGIVFYKGGGGYNAVRDLFSRILPNIHRQITFFCNTTKLLHDKGKGDIIIIYSYSSTFRINPKKKGQNILKYI